MKDIGEVDAAADLAVRFNNIDIHIGQNTGVNSVLNQVLSSSEKGALETLLNREQGPFTDIWINGDYRWDGKAEAEKFWRLVHDKRGV